MTLTRLFLLVFFGIFLISMMNEGTMIFASTLIFMFWAVLKIARRLKKKKKNSFEFWTMS